MVGFKKGAPAKKKKKTEKSGKEKGLVEDNKIKENKKKKPAKEKKSRFSKKKEKEVEELSQEELLGIAKKEPDTSIKCFCHLCGQSIGNEESVGDPTYTKWFMGELKNENLPPIDATVSRARYTTELGNEIRIAVESVSDDIPEDIIQEDSSMNIEPKHTKPDKRKVEVNIL